MIGHLVIVMEIQPSLQHHVIAHINHLSYHSLTYK